MDGGRLAGEMDSALPESGLVPMDRGHLRVLSRPDAVASEVEEFPPSGGARDRFRGHPSLSGLSWLILNRGAEDAARWLLTKGAPRRAPSAWSSP